MPTKTKTKPSEQHDPATLAQNLSEALLRERCIPRFVDSYVVEHGRHSIQVHAGLYRDLLNLLQREGLLTISARALDLVAHGSNDTPESKQKPMTRKEASSFRQKFLAALTRQQRWNLGDSLSFQSDLRMYEELIARAGAQRRPRKPYEPANHPFVDRCAFVLDSSFLEKARVAASRALIDLESLAAQVVNSATAAKNSG
jgi:hypothetical protein